MTFKIGDRVGLDAYIAYDYFHSSYTKYQLTKDFCSQTDRYSKPEFGTIELLHKDGALVKWDEKSTSSQLKQNLNSEFISLEFLCSEEDLLKKVKDRDENFEKVEEELKSLFKEMSNVFRKICAANTTNLDLRHFDSADCLKDFIDQAGWSSSSLNC